MKEKEARTLKVGSAVYWSDDAFNGNVAEIGYAGFSVEWEDGKLSMLPFKGGTIELLRRGTSGVERE